MKNKYSIFSLARNAVTYHENWAEAWRSPEPKKKYDVIVIGGGGHGLATAYYLASQHGIRNVAVLEKNWIGGGNTGRNTAIVRSNYLWDESAHLYEKSLKLGALGGKLTGAGGGGHLLLYCEPNKQKSIIDERFYTYFN